jgi:hypothetical protein
MNYLSKMAKNLRAPLKFLSLPQQKIVISTEAARPHRVAQWRDPRISSLFLSFPALNPRRRKIVANLQLFNRISTLAFNVVVSSLLLTTLSASAQTAPAAPASAQVQPWKQIPIPPLPAFKPAEPHRVELPNGVVLFLQEDHELPFINGTILIRGGSRDEPNAKVGLTSLYGETWRTSGTAAISGDKLDDVLEDKAASIETAGGTSTPSSPTPPTSSSTQPSKPTSSNSPKISSTQASPAATTTPAASPTAKLSRSPTARTTHTPASSNTPPSTPSPSTTSTPGTPKP